MEDPEAVELPIDGTLDLHTFQPSEVDELVPEYIAACIQHGIYRVRIIHGKGKGILRRKVHSILSKLQEVSRFSLADDGGGGWGATIVHLRLPDEG